VTGVGVRVRGLLGGVAVTAACLIPAAPASADVITPPGACVASGVWQNAGLNEESVKHQTSDVIEVPRKDTVAWKGNIKGYALGTAGPQRTISGEIQLDLPIKEVTIDSWGGDSVRYANEGEHTYNLPSVLIGIEMRLHGEHRENNVVVCSGEVNVKVAGSIWSNPLTFADLGLLVISAAILYFAGKPVFKKNWAYEDANPG
jgi:hypothetical protein